MLGNHSSITYYVLRAMLRDIRRTRPLSPKNSESDRRDRMYIHVPNGLRSANYRITEDGEITSSIEARGTLQGG